jgi:6-phosphogluconolactonase
MGKARVTRAAPQVEVLPDPEALARRVADWMLEITMRNAGRLAIALAGGSTPRATYALMASMDYRDRFPWQRMHWFWGDERFVPYDSPRSNYRMAHEALLSRVAIPAANIHPVPTGNATPEGAARDYERTLKSFYGSNRLDPSRPLFDINLLGLGEDGHLASLFPGTEALQERERWVASVEGPQAEPRVTLTYPALESCRTAVILVSGAGKASIFGRLRASDPALPASRLEPHGMLHIFADRAAASEMS